MRFHKIFPVSVLLVSLSSLPALAGSSYVENSFRLRSIRNGKSVTKVNVKEIYRGHRSAGSDAIKREWGKTTVTEARDGRDFREIDSFDITTRSYARESGDFRTKTNVNVIESYDFSGFEKNHRVTAGFDF